MIEPFLMPLLPGSENSCVSFGLPDVLIPAVGQLTSASVGGSGLDGAVIRVPFKAKEAKLATPLRAEFCIVTSVIPAGLVIVHQQEAVVDRDVLRTSSG